MKKLIVTILFSLSLLNSFSQAKFYISDMNGEPWGSTSNPDAMDLAFGVGNWNQGFYQTINVNALLQPTVCLIYMDGGDGNATEMDNFVTSNLTAIQNWVFNGGKLFLNAAPNVGNNMLWGFGGVTLNYNFGPYSYDGVAVNNAHPIFVGPNAIATFTHNDNYFAHSFVTGPGMTPIIDNNFTAWDPDGNGNGPFGGNVILASKPWGAGLGLFGGMTNTSFHNPQPSADNLRANMLVWLYVCCTQPTLTAVASPTSVCAGFPTTLSVSGAGVGGTYTWTPPAGGATVTGSSAVFSPTATGIYSVAGTNTAGCVGNTTIQIVVNPTPTITAVANPSAVCLQGQTTSTITFGGAQSYTLQPLNITGASVVVSPTVATIYTIAGTSSLGCVSSTTIQIGINPSTTATATSPSVCQGFALNLTSGGGNAYLWSGPGSFTSNLQNPVIANPTPTNNGQYTVVVTSSLGCTASAVTNVSVTPSPTASISHNALTGICVGSTLNLSGSGPLGAGYTWSGPNAFISSQQSPTIAPVSLLSAGVYSLMVTVSTCTGMVTETINVNPLPNPQLMSNNPVCLNQAITFTASGAISYTIVGPNGYNTNNPLAIIQVANNNSAGIYTLIASDANNCTNSVTAGVTVKSLPLISAIGSTVCANNTIQLSASGGSVCSWLGPLNFSSNSFSVSIPNAVQTMAGNYTVVITGTNGCTNASIANVKVNQLPNPLATVNSPICEGKEIKLTVTDQFATGYSWIGPNGFTSVFQNPVIENANSNMSGSYTVTVSDDIGCNGITVVNVLVNAMPTASINTNNNNGCVPVCMTMTTVSNSQINSIEWYANDGNFIGGGPILNNCFRNAGTYSISSIFKDNNECQGKSTYLIVNAYPIPVADFIFEPIKPIVYEEVVFTDASSNAIVTDWMWYFTNQKNNTITGKSVKAFYENAGSYPVALIVGSNFGCTDTIVKTVIVGEEFNLYIPNVFTPNGDGLNDTFQPKGSGIIKYELSIFDRWGEKIFVTTDFANGWNGTFARKSNKVVEDGVYVWQISVTNTLGKSKEFTGKVTLMK